MDEKMKGFGAKNLREKEVKETGERKTEEDITRRKALSKGDRKEIG